MNEEVIKVTIDETGAAKGLDNLRDDLNRLKAKATETGKASGNELEKGFKEHAPGVKGLLNDLTGGMANMFEDVLDSVKFLGVGIKGLKTAIVASGIGVLLVAAGTLVAYWDDLKEAVSGVSAEMNATAKAAEQAVAASEKELNNVSETENILKLQGKSEMDILKIKQEKAKVEISALEAQIESQKAIKAAQVDAAKRNKDILMGILQFTFAPLKAIAASVDYIGEKLGKNWGLADKVQSLTESTANLVFDPEQTATEADATIAETEKKLLQLKNQEAGFQLQIRQIKKDAAAKAAEDQAKADAEELARRKALFGEFEKLEAKGVEVTKKSAEDAFAASLERSKKEQALREKEVADKAAADKAEADRVRQINAAKVQVTADGLSAIIALNEAFGTKNGQLSKAAFERGKKLQIAQALIQTYQSATAAYSSQAAIPIVGPVLGGIAAAAAIASGIAQIKKIQSTQYESPQASSSGSYSSASLNAGSSPTPNLTLPKLDQANQNPMKAYVVATDVTRQGEAQQVIKRQTELGG